MCDDCGENWKQTGHPADDLGVFAFRAAESPDQADRVDTDEELVIVMDDETAKGLAIELRKLAQT